MLAQLQRIPKPGDSFEYGGRRFTVLDMENRRIARVLIENIESHTAKQAGD
jgi:CBS domain containing-hemolysin-like protein